MRLDEAFAQLNIVQDFIPRENSNRPGTPLNPRAITIHNTDNAERGANAAAHARYLKGKDARDRQVSWHYTVDDTSVYQSLPTNEIGWHAATRDGNASSLGIEICMNAGMDEKAAYDRAALLVAVLARENDIEVPEAIVQHYYWSGKNCPRVLRAKPNGWKNFLSAVKLASEGLRSSSATRIEGPSRDHGMALAGVKALAGKQAKSLASDVAKIPAGNPVPFAAFASGAANPYWPIITSSPQALVVSYRTTTGTYVGREGRSFLAARRDGARNHVGVDLFANEGDEVLSCADGKIVAFYPFYTRSATGEEAYALLIQHDGVVVNYGEVRANSPQVFGWKVGDSVKAGQKIARVSGTSMVHFETYTSGTKRNARWLVGGSRPANLLNPTLLLLSLANDGVRIDLDGVASASSAKVPGIEPVALASIADAPAPVVESWHSRFNGQEWRYDQRGVYTRDKRGQETLWRSDGEPVTCRDILKFLRREILAASNQHGVNPALIIMTIATETAFARGDGFTGRKTFRWEPGVQNTDVKPPFMGSYSAGPMQCLATTVREMLSKFGKSYGFAQYKPFVVAPALTSRPVPPPSSHPLYDGETNVNLGTAEIRMRWNRTGADPILVAAAFNAGGLYPDPRSSWGLRAYGDHLDRAARWYGDACEVLSEAGLL